jgi:VanZ family protein
MHAVFTEQSDYKKIARFIAILWTLLILFGCFMPAAKVPKVDVPLMDKWVHFTMFGGFAMAWLFAWPSVKISRFLTVLIIAILFGSAIEVMQGVLPALGRASELFDAVADGIGAVLGAIAFRVLSLLVRG